MFKVGDKVKYKNGKRVYTVNNIWSDDSVNLDDSAFSVDHWNRLEYATKENEMKNDDGVYYTVVDGEISDDSYVSMEDAKREFESTQTQYSTT